MPDGDSIPVTLRGGLTIRGVNHERAFTGWVWRRPNGNVRFRGSAPIDLKDCIVETIAKDLKCSIYSSMYSKTFFSLKRPCFLA